MKRASSLRWMFLAAWAAASLALAAPPASEETGGWTNLAGHVLKAEPVALKGQAVSFKPVNGGPVVEYPLSLFPPSEQERLRVALKDTSVPPGLQTAYEFSARILKRSRLLVESGEMSPAEYEKSQEAALDALRRQAVPLVDQQKLSPERLEILLHHLATNPE